jgi:chlorobactene glucosyltransferase
VTPAQWEWMLGGVYALLGPVVWGLFAFGLYKGRKRLNLLRRPIPPLPVDAPHVTILIPAKDEGQRIRECITTALSQDYPRFDVVAINDRSADETGQIMQELAVANERLRVMNIQPGSLPPRWTGKCNALHNAVKQARGQWLLFVDSDVVLEPDVLRATMAVVLERRFDLISLLPAFEGHSFWERLLVPLCGGTVGTMYLVPFMNAGEGMNDAFANGQYMCVNRQAYEAIGGHVSVYDKFCEDVELARILKRSGWRPRVSWGSQWAQVRMYSSTPAIIRGWSRNFFAASLGRPWRIIAAIVFIMICCYSVYPAVAMGFFRLWSPVVAFGGAMWLAGAIFHFVAMTASIGIIYSWTRNSWRNALWFPLSGVMLLLILSRALWMCITGRVEWRGTRYTHRMQPRVAGQTQ